MNPYAGEFELKAGEKSYTLAFSHKAMAQLEGEMNLTAQQILEQVPKLDVIIKLLVVMLKRHHDMTYDEAAELMDLVGTEAATKVITAAVNRGFTGPSQKKETAENPL